MPGVVSVRTMKTPALFALLAWFTSVTHAPACLAIAPGKGAVVNADQSVIMIWDAARQEQHFIRQANFKTDAADVGFIVPSPSRPTLSSAGKAAFPRLEEITAPAFKPGGGFGFGCSTTSMSLGSFSSVRVIEEKRVAGYDATVLTAESGADLVAWLRDHGYSYSPEVAAWAQPYLGGGWHFTALKVAKDGGAEEIRAAALRITFRTERPLFPYREPASAAAAQRLGVKDRLLRIYFISEARYRAEVAGGNWSGKVVWSGDITPHRSALLADLKMPAATLPGNWWLTEFEDHWPYEQAAGDVYFSRDSSQKTKTRPDVTAQVRHDGALVAFVAVAALRPLRRRRRG